MAIYDSRSFDVTKFNTWKNTTKTSQASKPQTVVSTTHSNSAAYHTNNHNNVAEYTTYTYTPHTNTTSAVNPITNLNLDEHVNSIINANDDDFIVGSRNRDTITYSQTEYSRTYSKSGDNIHYDVGTYHRSYEKSHSDYSDYSRYSKYSQHTDIAESTTPVVHPHVNSGHTNNVPHSNYGFTHNNNVPYTPDVFALANNDRIKDTITIGYFSYDKDNDTVYYDIQYRQIKDLDDLPISGPWTTLVNKTTNNTVQFNTTGVNQGYYEIKINAYNEARTENGLTKTYISGAKVFTVKVHQNKVPQILNIRGTVITSDDIVDKWANNMPTNFTYKVYDYDNDMVQCKHYLNNNQIETITVNSESIVNFVIPQQTWDSLPIGSHMIKIEVSDNIDPSIFIEKEIIKLDDRLLFVTHPHETDTLAIRANIALLYKKDLGDTLQIWVCNNAFDDNPTWEDCTNAYFSQSEYFFKNKNKVNDKAGIAMKVLLKKSFAKEE